MASRVEKLRQKLNGRHKSEAVCYLSPYRRFKRILVWNAGSVQMKNEGKIFELTVRTGSGGL